MVHMIMARTCAMVKNDNTVVLYFKQEYTPPPTPMTRARRRDQVVNWCFCSSVPYFCVNFPCQRRRRLVGRLGAPDDYEEEEEEEEEDFFFSEEEDNVLAEAAEQSLRHLELSTKDAKLLQFKIAEDVKKCFWDNVKLLTGKDAPVSNGCKPAIQQARFDVTITIVP